MKSGTTFALLLGAIAGIAGIVLRIMHWPSGNGLLIAAISVLAIAFVFRMLQSASNTRDERA